MLRLYRTRPKGLRSIVYHRANRYKTQVYQYIVANFQSRLEGTGYLIQVRVCVLHLAVLPRLHVAQYRSTTDKLLLILVFRLASEAGR